MVKGLSSNMACCDLASGVKCPGFRGVDLNSAYPLSRYPLIRHNMPSEAAFNEVKVALAQSEDSEEPLSVPQGPLSCVVATSGAQVRSVHVHAKKYMIPPQENTSKQLLLT